MDGAKRKCRSPLELQRVFVGFRLERQVLVRVYELVVPLFLQDEAEAADSSPAAAMLFSASPRASESEEASLPICSGVSAAAGRLAARVSKARTHRIRRTSIVIGLWDAARRIPPCRASLLQ